MSGTKPLRPAVGATAEPRSVRFRATREAEWSELEAMLTRAFARGPSRLDQEELYRLPALYRSALSSLNVARKTALDRALIEYLEALVGRAYLAIYTSSRPTRTPLRTLFLSRFPSAVRAMWPELSLSIALFSIGVLTSFVLVTQDPEWYFAFVGEALAGDRTPGSSTETLRQALYAGQEGEPLSIFASFLFTHNAGIGLLAFALGFAAGLPTALLVFSNGLMLGAFCALYASRGLLLPLLGWLLPHGVPEIGAILLCGGAGLTLGRAMIAPSEFSVRETLRLAGRRGAVVALGSIVLFLIAGFIEGVFRQLVQDDVLRFAIAAFNLVWLGAWILLGGRREAVVSS